MINCWQKQLPYDFSMNTKQDNAFTVPSQMFGTSGCSIIIAPLLTTATLEQTPGSKKGHWIIKLMPQDAR